MGKYLLYPLGCAVSKDFPHLTWDFLASSFEL